MAESLAEVNVKRHLREPKTYQRRMVALPASPKDRLAAHLAGDVES